MVVLTLSEVKAGIEETPKNSHMTPTSQGHIFENMKSYEYTTRYYYYITGGCPTYT
jgi:hypothetical protein